MLTNTIINFNMTIGALILSFLEQTNNKDNILKNAIIIKSSINNIIKIIVPYSYIVFFTFLKKSRYLGKKNYINITIQSHNH